MHSGVSLSQGWEDIVNLTWGRMLGHRLKGIAARVSFPRAALAGSRSRCVTGPACVRDHYRQGCIPEGQRTSACSRGTASAPLRELRVENLSGGGNTGGWGIRG